jgi:hypothetical protein
MHAGTFCAFSVRRNPELRIMKNTRILRIIDRMIVAFVYGMGYALFTAFVVVPAALIGYVVIAILIMGVRRIFI